MTDKASYIKRNKLKTAFGPQRTFAPIYTGGKVALTQDGLHAYTTLDEDILLTETMSGQELGRVQGDSPVSTFALTPQLSTETGTLIVARKSLQLQWYSVPFADSNASASKTVHRAHDAPIITMSADPSSHIYATGAADGIVKVWSIEGGFCTHVFKGHGGVISAFAWDLSIPNDARLVSGADDCRIRVWNLKNRKCEAILEGHVSVVRGLAVTEDGSTLVSAGRDQVVNIWPLKRNPAKTSGHQPKNTFPVLETVEACGLLEVPVANPSSKGKGKQREETHTAIFTAGDKGQLRLWSLATGHLLAAEHSTSAKPVEIVDAFWLSSPSMLVSVRVDQNIISHNLPSLSPVRQIIGFNDEAIDCLFLSTPSTDEPANRLETHLAVATNSELIRLYDLSDAGFSNTALLSGHTDIVLALAKSPDGSILLSGGKDRTARIWTQADSEQITWRSVAICEGHLESVGAVALSKSQPASSFAVTASQDRTVKIWSLEGLSSLGDGEEHRLKSLLTQKIHDKDINAIDVSPNDKLLASGSQDKTAKLFALSVEDGKPASLQLLGVLKGHKRGVWSVKFSSTDQVLATASGDKTIKLWSAKDYTCLKTFEGHTNSVLRVDFISAGMQLVSCASDGLVKVWNIKDEESAITLDNHDEKIWALAISKDESKIVSGGADSVVTVWADVSVEQELEKAAEAEELVLKNQDFNNFVATKDYRSAILLALAMDQPRRLLKLFSSLPTPSMTSSGAITGAEAVDAALRSLSPDELLRLLGHVRDWNTSVKSSDIAQRVLHVILRGHTATKLLALERTPVPSTDGLAAARPSKSAASVSDLLEGLLPYTERHFNRADKALAQESFVLDYTLRQMDFDFRDVEDVSQGRRAMLVDA